MLRQPECVSSAAAAARRRYHCLHLPPPMQTNLPRTLKGLALAMGQALFSRARPLPPGFEPRKILVMQLQQLGDSLIFTPAVRALRRRFPQAQIDMLVNPVSLAFHRKSPYVGKFHVASHWRAGTGGTRIGPLLPLL